MLHFIFGLISISVSLIFVFNKRNNAENGSLPRAFEFLGFFFCATCTLLADDPKRGLPSFLVAYVANLM